MQLPLSYPDEIIFSRIVRHFTLSGMTCEGYLSDVFGNHKVTIHPYLTAGLEQVCNKLSHELPIDVLKKQTLAPLFMYFLPLYESTISNALILGKASEAIRACQLSCVREKEKISLKFCPECARENTQEFGTPYWHRSHQIPGVESCSLHRVKLEHFPLESRSRLNYYLLPPLNIRARPTNQLSFEFAQYAYEVLTQVSHSSKHFDLLAFKTQLQKFGYITDKGSYRRSMILKSLYLRIPVMVNTDSGFIVNT
ncbi:TniQ family protein [Pseudoalteromonas sp. SR45-4]|uniref:TniQ family protein n=1 Tax=Pseudoalteromonas sp. SR45-4 TaxID=2760929 RepID=UPI0015F96FA4|nr:TniQ family protein [Pseudoalteromonas sp. SR45-4]MBB1369435.1 TniQ family protein [Pseudoalteromonas sp. SR45-4]